MEEANPKVILKVEKTFNRALEKSILFHSFYFNKFKLWIVIFLNSFKKTNYSRFECEKWNFVLLWTSFHKIPSYVESNHLLSFLQNFQLRFLDQSYMVKERFKAYSKFFAFFWLCYTCGCLVCWFTFSASFVILSLSRYPSLFSSNSKRSKQNIQTTGDFSGSKYNSLHYSRCCSPELNLLFERRGIGLDFAFQFCVLICLCSFFSRPDPSFPSPVVTSPLPAQKQERQFTTRTHSHFPLI
jgi:hypothetical protein